MTITALDKKLSRALKSASTQRSPGAVLTDLQMRIGDPDTNLHINRTCELLRTPKATRNAAQAEAILEEVTTLCTKQLFASAEILFLEFVPALQQIPAERVFLVAPTAKSLAAWAKAAHISKKAIEDKILEHPEANYGAAALEWFLEKGEPLRSGPLTAMLLSKRPRPKHLPTWQEALAAQLFKDKTSSLLRSLLANHAGNPQHMETLVDLLLNESPLLLTIAHGIPALLQSNRTSANALSFLISLLDHAAISTLIPRRSLSAFLARLSSDLLLDSRPTSEAKTALQALQDANTRLKFTTSDEDLKAETWIFEPLKAATERLDGGHHVTLTGARHLVAALEKAQRGLSAFDILPATAKNLGLSTAGTCGEKVVYNPLQHEDTSGGLKPGQPVEITEPGWQFKNSMLLRAKVKAPAGTQHEPD